MDPKLDPKNYGITAALQEIKDHSFTGTYLECERMALYQTIWGRRGKYGDSYTLHWGKVFHKLAEVWQQRQDINEVIQYIDLNIPEEVDDRYGRNRGRMQELFIAWVTFRRTDPLEILRTEQPTTIACLGGPCPYNEKGCGLVYGGKLDEIARWNQMIGPLDFKTTVMDKTDPGAEYRPSHQMEGYTWITGHLIGKPCWGTIVERLVCNKSKIKIDRFPVSFDRDHIQEWIETEKDTHAEINQKFLDHPYNERAWKQNKARCFLPYPCRFRDVCNAPRDFGFRLRWMRDNTEEKRFDFRNPDDAPPEMGVVE